MEGASVAKSTFQTGRARNIADTTAVAPFVLLSVYCRSNGQGDVMAYFFFRTAFLAFFAAFARFLAIDVTSFLRGKVTRSRRMSKAFSRMETFF